jgi:ABC-type polysaccharide/polyol phosphate transport system ATPase subunit
MVMRLAFSVAIHVDPDILLIDEVLAVGDQTFQAKCFERILDFKKRGKTLLFVSHAPQLVASLCERCLWLDHGQVVQDGPAQEVMRAYQQSPAL